MLDDQSQTEIQSVVLPTRIIVLALCSGIIAFGLYVMFIHQADDKQEIGMLTPYSIAFVVLETILCLMVPRIIVGKNRKQIAEGTWRRKENAMPAPLTDAGKLASVFQTTTIIGCATLEGAAFFALIVHMLEGHVATLVAAGVMLIGVAMHMPLGGRVSSWVEGQLRIIDQEKQFPPLR